MSSLKGSMTTAGVACLIVVLAGCTTAHQYRRAGRELHAHYYTIWCWGATEQEWASNRTEMCDKSTASAADEKRCISTLADSATHRPALDLAVKQVESCMHDKGWSLVGIASYLVVKRTSSVCNLDDYTPEQCPHTADQDRP